MENGAFWLSKWHCAAKEFIKHDLSLERDFLAHNYERKIYDFIYMEA
jgi:hypothetical protein